MQNWFKKLLGKTEDANHPTGNVKDDLVALLQFLVAEIKSTDEKFSAQNRLDSYLKGNTQKQLENFPSIYIFLEQYLTELKESKQYNKKDLHALLLQKFPAIEQLETARIIFASKPITQKIRLSRFFLLHLIQRSYHILGATGDNMLVSAHDWLETVPENISHPLPFAMAHPLPEQEEDWIKLLQSISTKLHSYFEERFSEQFTKSLLENTYKQVADKFKNLSVFYIVIDLIPSKFLDEEKINLLSKQQLNQMLFDRVDNLRDTNTEIAEKNLALEQVQTRLVASEHKALDALHRLESVMDAVGEGIITIDETGTIKMVNNEVLTIWGYKRSELMGQNIMLLMPDHHKAQHEMGMKRFNQTQKSTIINKRIRLEGLRKNQEVFPLEINVKLVEVDEQKIFTAAVRDLTEVILQEEHIKVLARFPEENPQAVLRINANGKILYANQASRSILEFWNSAEHELVPSEWQLRIQHILSTTTSHDIEYTCGRIIFQMLLVPIPEAQYVNIYAKNITQRKEAEAQVIKQNKKIIDSIHYAKRIQNAMLREPREIKRVFSNSFILFQPRDIVSGDFYWFDIVNNKRFIAAVDCTGHGVPGAFMSMIGSNLLEEIIIRRQIHSPDEILDELHIGIRKALHQDATRIHDGMDISLCVVDQDKQVVEFSGAHNPLVYGLGEQIKVIRGNRFSIGGKRFGKERKFTKHVIPITADMTTFYIYTDGFQDQFGGEKNSKFMNIHFRDILKGIQLLPMKEQEHHLQEKLSNWMTNRYKQIDDILVIGFRVN